MKKAKIMITAITVLAVVGGALAFKVRQEHTFYIPNPYNPATCDFAVPNQAFTEDIDNGTLWQDHTITPSVAPCSVKTVPDA